jgi:hypothetical protein
MKQTKIYPEKLTVSQLVKRFPEVYKTQCIITNFMNYRAHLEKIKVTLLVKKFPIFYGIRRIITVFAASPSCDYPKAYKHSPYSALYSSDIHFNIILPSIYSYSK